MTMEGTAPTAAPTEGYLSLNVTDSVRLAHDLFLDANYAEAERLFRAATQIDPGNFHAVNGVGICLSELDRSADAMPWFDHAYTILRDEMAALSTNRAKALAEMGRSAEAMLMLDGLMRSIPNNSFLRFNRALVLLQTDRYEDAIAELNTVLMQEPENDKARFARGFARLVLGQYEFGFKDYECRLKDDIAEPDVPLWTGAEDLTGKTILVHAEMGLGDNIMFMRYVPMLAARASQVVVVVPESQRSIVPDLKRVTIATADHSTWPRLDYWIRFMSLALAFKTTVKTVPRPAELTFNPDDAGFWNELIASPRLKIGLCWSGSRRSRYDAWRSIPLAELAPLFDLTGVQFYGLQIDCRETDIETRSALNIINLEPYLTDFGQTAHALRHLDLVITCDTALAHLAGTVGVPTWIMLTAFRTYWLWMKGRTDTPWYPSVQFFRQSEYGEWGPVVEVVRQELAELIGTNDTKLRDTSR